MSRTRRATRLALSGHPFGLGGPNVHQADEDGSRWSARGQRPLAGSGILAEDVSDDFFWRPLWARRKTGSTQWSSCCCASAGVRETKPKPATFFVLNEIATPENWRKPWAFPSRARARGRKNSPCKRLCGPRQQPLSPPPRHPSPINI